MKKHIRMVEIELYNDKEDGSSNGKTYLLHLRIPESAGEEEVMKFIEEEYGFDMSSMWKINKMRGVNL